MGRNALALDRAALQEELLVILERDQRFRSGGHDFSLPAVQAQQQALDRANLARVIRIIDRHGWPKMSELGEDAALAVFLVVQHADSSLQARYLPELQRMYEAGEAKGAWLALMTDRLRIAEGRPQLYGTQMRRSESANGSEPFPVDDAGQVNARRVALGLRPIARYPPADPPPADAQRD